MKWTSPRLIKAYIALLAIANLVVAVIAECKWH